MLPNVALAQSTWDHDPLFGSRSNAEALVQSGGKSNLLRAAASDPRFTEIRGYIATLPDTDPSEIPHLIDDEQERKARLILANRSVDPAILRQGISPQTEALICPWLDSELRGLKAVPDDLYLIHFAHCSSDEFPLLDNQTAKPTEADRLRRAERMYGDVRFANAAAELDKITPTISESVYCRAWFIRGRTMYRIKARRSESEVAYKKVVNRCTDRTKSADWQLRKKALYGWGKRRFDLNDYKTSKRAFETLAAEYPDSTHVDDALLYLARIARRTGKAQKPIVERAMQQQNYGDMTFEIAWEYVEPWLRKGAYQEFLDELKTLQLPDHDQKYFSQGRLEYFRAFAHKKLNESKSASDAWLAAWTKYPFSFYGYLSALRLDQNGVPRSALAKDDREPIWLRASAAERDALAVALRHDPTLAGWIASNMSINDPAAQWRVAHALHTLGAYPQSHNVVRRNILGRPWVMPEQGRMTRLEIAWPMPYATAVAKAVEAESKQHPKAHLHPAFPTAIMREESSFIEDVESWAGALGLMQLMPRTALGHDNDIDGEATPERLKTAEVNVRVAADHLFWLSRKLDGHPALMAAAYNAGLGAVNRWLKSQPNDEIALFVEDIPYLQARDYTKRVVGSYAAYQFLMGENKLDARLSNPAKK